MKNLLTLFFFCSLLIISTISFGQNRESRTLDKFNKLIVSEGIIVHLTHGKNPKCTINASGIETSEVLTTVSGGRLKIHLEDFIRRRRNIDVEIELTYDEINDIEVNSGGKIDVRGKIESYNLDLTLTSAGSADLLVAVEDLRVDITSAAHLKVSGNANFLDVDVTSAGVFSAPNLKCNKVDASASSAGNVSVYAIKEIRAKASSAGNIKYSGNPERSNVHSSSGGSVHKRN